MTSRIIEIWNEAEGYFPEKSTEWLMQRVCEIYQKRHGKVINHGHVADALAAQQEEYERERSEEERARLEMEEMERHFREHPHG